VVLFRIDVGLAARQQNRGASGDTARDFFRRQRQRNNNGLAATRFHRAYVRRQSPVAVFFVIRARLGNGDPRFYSTCLRSDPLSRQICLLTNPGNALSSHYLLPWFLLPWVLPTQILHLRM